MKITPEDPVVHSIVLQDDGTFPNNPRPLLLYSGAVPADPDAIERLFTSNDWPSAWRNGVYPYHHYHSTAHEALGVYSGSATIQFGGPAGPAETIHSGDVAVIPAGVAHKCLESSADFRIVGAYPRGQSWDMCYGKPGERPRADRNITAVADPQKDPVQGSEGALSRIWPAS
ncbi:MAG: hypothetical protein JSV89_02025 [Spirochaetaceae bacterium]|nr:MAG: hypothetical protein JSV89_02025 [Spirochaetaceae bacterium]